jgi:hypothetical protein
MTAAIGFIGIEQQCTKANINSYVRFNYGSITILYTAGNIVRKIGAIDGIDINSEIFIGG